MDIATGFSLTGELDADGNMPVLTGEFHIADTWDGKDLNGNACPQGTYVYIIRYVSTFEPDREHLLKGTVTLIR